jgi:hypothetical protein
VSKPKTKVSAITRRRLFAHCYASRAFAHSVNPHAFKAQSICFVHHSSSVYFTQVNSPRHHDPISLLFSSTITAMNLSMHSTDHTNARSWLLLQCIKAKRFGVDFNERALGFHWLLTSSAEKSTPPIPTFDHTLTTT